jgi:hypothetical protein
VGLSNLGVFAALCGIAGIVQTFRDWNRAVYLFDGGFIIVKRRGVQPAVFPWKDIIKVRKRVSAFESIGWNSYTEAEKSLEGGRLLGQVNPRVTRPGPARTKFGVRCSYLVWRSDGLMTWLKPEYRNIDELGEAILSNAPTVHPGPSAGTSSGPAPSGT